VFGTSEQFVHLVLTKSGEQKGWRQVPTVEAEAEAEVRRIMTFYSRLCYWETQESAKVCLSHTLSEISVFTFICIIGSLMLRFADDVFNESFVSTIGVDYVSGKKSRKKC
jgi:hypothetical protein